MELCDKCGKPIKLREKLVLSGEDKGVYHGDCATKVLGRKTRKVLDTILWIMGFVAVGFLVYGILKVLLSK